MKETLKIIVKDKYINYFNEEPNYFISAKSRYEILGNHTDHNHGLCISSDCPLETACSVNKLDENKIIFKSENYDLIQIDLDDLEINKEEYQTSKALIKGVVRYLIDHNYKIGGFKAYCISEVPIGSGLSSSASFEIVIANIVSTLFNNDKIPPLIKAYAGQYSENNYYKKASGLLDQISIAFPGIKYINFNRKNKPQIMTLQTSLIDILQVAIINPKTSHEKLDNLYEKIPNTMYKIARLYNHDYLAQFTRQEINDLFKKNIHNISQDELNIAKHFFDENKRVKMAKNVILNNDVDLLFSLIKSLAKSNYLYLKNSQIGDIYENSLQNVIDFCNEILDTNIAVKLTGGGYSGACIAFIKNKKFSKLETAIKECHPDWDIMLIN